MTCQKEINPSVGKKTNKQKKTVCGQQSTVPKLKRCLFFPNQPIIFEAWAPCKSCIQTGCVRRQGKTALEAKVSNREEKKKHRSSRLFSSSQHPLFRINKAISIFQITELGVNHCSVLRTKITQDRLSVRSSDPPWRSPDSRLHVWPVLP